MSVFFITHFTNTFILPQPKFSSGPKCDFFLLLYIQINCKTNSLQIPKKKIIYEFILIWTDISTFSTFHTNQFAQFYYPLVNCIQGYMTCLTCNNCEKLVCFLDFRFTKESQYNIFNTTIDEELFQQISLKRLNRTQHEYIHETCTYTSRFTFGYVQTVNRYALFKNRCYIQCVGEIQP